jgi:hypothetical protein
LLKLDNFGQVKSWRKIFFVEGVITTSVGLILFFITPGDPLTTRMLNEKERALAIARLNADAIVKTDGKMEPTTFKRVMKSFNIWVRLILCLRLLYDVESASRPPFALRQ